MQAFLALEDGRIFRGESYGAKRECFGEVVFNTALTGYQEIFTDPSYAGQIVVLTNPQIGNYGTNAADNEASRPYIEGLVTREFSPISSNWRSQQVTEEYLERFNVPVIAEIDTRAVVRHLRTHGALRGVISSLETDPQKLVEKARSIRKMDGTDLAKVVSTKTLYEWDCHDRRNFNGDPLQQGDESLKLPPPGSARSRLRLRHQAQHPAHAVARSLPGHRRPGRNFGRGRDGAQPRRHLSSPTVQGDPEPVPMLRKTSAS